MAAVIYRKNHIIAIGFASPITHLKLVNAKSFLPSLHAEIDAFRKAYNGYCRTHKKHISANMLVVRLSTYNYYAISKPCLNCLKFLSTNIGSLSIKNISYADNDAIVTEKLANIKTSHISRGWRLRK